MRRALRRATVTFGAALTSGAICFAARDDGFFAAWAVAATAFVFGVLVALEGFADD